MWKGNRLLLYTERRVALSTQGRECPLLYVEEADSFSVQGSRCLLYTSESVPLLYVEGGHTLYTEYRVPPIHRRQSVPPPSLYTEERVTSFHRGEIVPLLYVEEAGSFSVQKRDCLLYTEKRMSLCYL